MRVSMPQGKFLYALRITCLYAASMRICPKDACLHSPRIHVCVFQK